LGSTAFTHCSCLPIRTQRNDVADRQVLELWNDPLRAVPAQVVEPVIAVPTGPSQADLNQPRPDLFRRGGDRNGSRGVERGPRNIVIARHRTPNLRIGRATAELPRTNEVRGQGDDGSQREPRRVTEHHGDTAAKDLGVFNIAGALSILAIGGGSYGVLYAFAGGCAIMGAAAVLPVKRVR
jgi:hypothetical protein